MTTEKRQWLIDNGLLNPDGSRPPHIPPPSDAGAAVVAEAEAVAVQAVDPNQGG